MDTLEKSLGFLLADITRLMRRAFQQRLEGSALPLAQARALLYIARNEGIRQVELADLLEVQPITVARLVDQLAERGLVERRPDPADRRAHQLHPTADAGPQLEAIEQVTTGIRASALQGLDAQEAATVLAALHKMRRNLAPGQ